MRNALTGQPVDRTPVWFMRQAGRYLPEYLEVRSKVSFLELCGSPELACKVTLQPLDRFDLDAAIVFSDILTIPEAMGQEVQFIKGRGPVLPSPLRSRADIQALIRPDVHTALPYVPATLKMFQSERPEVPILGFTGAPWTLLCYMVEGSGSKNWEHAKRLLWEDPVAAKQLLMQLADVIGDYLQAQIDAGAAAVQMFDTWAGALSPEDYRTFALPAAQRALSRVKGAPRLYFTKDSSPFLRWLPETGADALGLDWRVDIGDARRQLGDMPVQGNLDPVALYAPPEEIARRTHAILDAAGPVGHVFNLGHGVLPTTPIEGVHAMVNAVKSHRRTEPPPV
jgi:uroporphyrinogen decarboxylase